MKLFIEEIQSKMEQVLPKDRFMHTVGVAHLASAIAMCYGEDYQKAMIAGLLHDNAKYIPYDEAILACEENALSVSDTERQSPFLLHGKLGAFYAKTKYNVDDEEILSAITYHTTGKVAMSFLEKNIFLADYIEPRRTQPTSPDLSIIRVEAFHCLDRAVYYALDNTLNYLGKTQRPIDGLSVQAFEYYKQQLGL